MGHSHETHKETRKKPKMSVKDKRHAKQEKKSGHTLLGSHSPE